MGKRSIREFYSSPTRYLAQAIGKESEFEKPYLEEDRAKMHMDFPWPNWPPMPNIPPYPPLPPVPGPGPVPGCAITCYAPGGGDCEDPVWCHPSIWCGTDMGCTLCSWEVEGATTGYTPHHTGVGSWGIDIWIDQDLLESGGEALITACMTDPCGNICCEDVEISCKVCPPETAISWDDIISAETISREGQGGYAPVAVAVQDGVGPYSWSVAGTGFSMTNPTTEGGLNTLEADNTACGAATITVTDYCGDTTVGYVRCTIGSHWELQDDSCGLSGSGTQTGSGGASGDCMSWFDYELISGNKKQTQRTCKNSAGYSAPPCPSAAVISWCASRCVGPGIDCNNCIDPVHESWMPHYCVDNENYECWNIEERGYYLWICD